MKTALITGTTGQDGSYLAKSLLSKGYKVYGGERRSTTNKYWRLDEMGITDDIEFVELDVIDQANIRRAVEKTKPDVVYNLAAQSFVGLSFEQPELATLIDAMGVLRMVESIRQVNPEIKFYQASTSELYGKVQEVPQTEKTKFWPRSPYGVAKLYGHHITINYREAYNMFASTGILFNHESPMRGEDFVTRKISRAVGRISVGLQSKLTLGNLDASRDWGYAKDYVKGMWMMLQHDNPEDWVLATGNTKTVREFAEAAFNVVGLNWEDYVESSEKYYRPNEVDYLLGDSSKARKILGWKPEVNFEGLVQLMVEEDITEAKKDLSLINEGLILPTWEHPIIKN